MLKSESVGSDVKEGRASGVWVRGREGECLALIAGRSSPRRGPASCGGDKALERSGGLASLASCHVLPTLGLLSPGADRRELAKL
jgi:hypothetical protein